MFQIRIGKKTPALDACLRVNDCTTWAFITAWNPYGAPDHDLKANIARNRSLMTSLHQLDCIVLPAWGIPDVPEWPPEASFLALGISKSQATLIATRFDQHAYVYGERGAKAQLVQLSSTTNANFYATTYASAPLQLTHGKSLETWLTYLHARRLQFSKEPMAECVFQHDHHGGYLCWLKD